MAKATGWEVAVSGGKLVMHSLADSNAKIPPRMQSLNSPGKVGRRFRSPREPPDASWRPSLGPSWAEAPSVSLGQRHFRPGVLRPICGEFQLR